MEKLRTLIVNYSRWKNLEIQIQKIQYHLDIDFGSAIGLGKSLLESICKTILDEQKVSYNNDSINKLIKTTIDTLKIGNKEEISKFSSGLVTATQNLGELRNRIDSSSHGKSLLINDNNPIEKLSTNFLINSIEIIACFLIEFYEIEHPRKQQEKKLEYEECQEFNDYLDDQYEAFLVADVSILASMALFTDKIAYQNEYQEYLSQKEDETN